MTLKPGYVRRLASREETIPGFRDTDRLRLDYHTLGFATTSDFFRIAREMPGLLRIVE